MFYLSQQPAPFCDQMLQNHQKPKKGFRASLHCYISDDGEPNNQYEKYEVHGPKPSYKSIEKLKKVE